MTISIVLPVKKGFWAEGYQYAERYRLEEEFPQQPDFEQEYSQSVELD